MESAQIWTTSAPWVMELQCVLKLALLVHDMNLAHSNKYPLAHRHSTRTGWNPLLFKHCKAVINRSDYTVVKPPNNSITHTRTYIFSSSKVLKGLREASASCIRCWKKAGSEEASWRSFWYSRGLFISLWDWTYWALIWDPISNPWLFIHIY